MTETWQPIDSAPKDTEILVFTKPWGTIIARCSGEAGEWLSRMQVPVSIREPGELPTHWQPLPEPPEGTGGSSEPETETSEAEPARSTSAA